MQLGQMVKRHQLQELEPESGLKVMEADSGEIMFF